MAKTSDSGNHIKNYFCSDCGVYYKTELRKALADDTHRNAALRAENEVFRNSRRDNNPSSRNTG